MPLFTRKKNSSPLPSPQGRGGINNNNIRMGISGGHNNDYHDPALRSRVQHRYSANKKSPNNAYNMILPLTNIPQQQQQQQQYSSSTRIKPNNFLLGGMYVPGKDKRHRRRHISPRIHHSNGTVYRRMKADIYDLWERLWYTSPIIAILCFIFLLYILIFHFIVPLCRFILWDHEVIHLHKHNRGIDWLLTDTTLDISSIKEYRSFIEKFAIERERANKEEARLEMLETVASDWYHRNDNDNNNNVKKIVKPQTNAKKENNDNKNHDNNIGNKKSETTENKRIEKNKNIEIPAETPSPDDSRRLNNNNNNNGAVPSSVEKIIIKKHHNVSTTAKEYHIQRTLQTEDMIPNDSSCPINIKDDEYMITLVIQSSIDRIWVLDETCKRWTDPIIAVIAIKPEERMLEEVQHLYGWKDKCTQLNIFIYHLDEIHNEHIPEQYPVNYLRNMALNAVETSHVLVIDVDFVPINNLQDIIRNALIKRSTFNTNNTTTDKDAIVIPAFERVLKPPCKTVQECANHLRHDSTFIPQNFVELQHCVINKDCIVFQSNNNWEGHSSTRSYEWLDKKWYNDNDNNDIRSIECFDSLRYEPYVVIRWCPTAHNIAKTQQQLSSHNNNNQINYKVASATQNNHSTQTTTYARPIGPYYDERFHGYGKNKIQHISRLRLMGYKFYILPEGYIVHNPHVESAVKDRWNNIKESNLHHEMDILYQKFLNELVDKYYNTYRDEIIDQCPR